MITEARKKDVFKNLQKLEAYQEIQNEMGRTVAAFNFRQADKILLHFALEEEDVSLEYRMRVFFKDQKQSK